MVDPKATLARDRLGEGCDGLLSQVFDGPAGSANEVVVMAWLAPDVRRDVTGSLEPLRQPGADQPVE
jgi:hypothetical protein